MPGKGRPPQAIPSPISRHIITCYVRYQGSIHTVIYILVQTIMSVQAKLEVIRRKHIVHLTGFGAYSSTCYKGTDNCAGTMGVDQLPSSTVKLYTSFISACIYIFIYLFIYLGFSFTIVLYVCYLLWNYFMCILLYMTMCMLLSATSTHFKW